MALFKILKGQSKNLPENKTEGYAYVTTDEHKMYIDTSNKDRITLNAENAESLTLKNISSTGEGHGSNYIHLFTWTSTIAWRGVTGLYGLIDSEGTVNGIFSVQFRSNRNVEHFSSGANVEWIATNKPNLLPALVLTYEPKVDANENSYVIYRLYIVASTYKTYSISKIQEKIGDGVIAEWVGQYDATTSENEIECKRSNSVSATKLSSGTVGTGANLLYFNDGRPQISNKTVGASNKPVYLSNGTIITCDYRFGGASSYGDTWDNYAPVVKSDGGMEIGKYIDFHSKTNATNEDRYGRIMLGAVSDKDASTKFTFTGQDGAKATIGVNKLTATEIYGTHYGTLGYPLKLTLNDTQHTYEASSASMTSFADGVKFYAPETVGTENQLLVSNGSGAPTWTNTLSANTGFYLNNSTQRLTLGNFYAGFTNFSTLVGKIYAPLNSPALIGTPTAPTAETGTNTTQIATTAFVRTEIANLVNGAPEQLNTLKELADALGNDKDLAASVTEQLGEIKKDLTNETASRIAADETLSRKIAEEKESLQNEIAAEAALRAEADANYLPLAGGSMTGTLNLSDPTGINVNKESFEAGYYFANPSSSSINLISQPFSQNWFDRLAFLRTATSNLDQAEIIGIEYKDASDGDWIIEEDVTASNKLLTLFDQKSIAYKDTANQYFLTTEGQRFARRFTILDSNYNYSSILWLVLYTTYSRQGAPGIRVQVEKVTNITTDEYNNKQANETIPLFSPSEIPQVLTDKNYYIYLGANATNSNFLGLRFTFELIEPYTKIPMSASNYKKNTYYILNEDGEYVKESGETVYNENIRYYLPCEMRLCALQGLSARQGSQGLGKSIELPFIWDKEQNIQAKITPINTPKTGAYWNGVPIVSQYGAMEVGKYIDFHNTNTSTNNYDTRLQSTNKEGTTVTINLPKTDGTLALTDDVLYTNATGTTATIGGINQGTTFENMPIKDIIEQLLYPYVAPKITLKKTNNNDPSVFELGVGATLTFTTTVTQGSSTISAVDLYDSNNNKQTTGWTNNAGTQTSSAINITDTTTFVAKVTDGENKTISSSKVTITGVDPFFHGTVSEAPTTSAAIEAVGEKNVETKGEKKYTFATTSNKGRYCICYPKSYGTLTTILDANGFDNTADFTRTEVTRSRANAINGIIDVPYYVYTYNNVIIPDVHTNFTFKFS